jgi:hypothetical protein
VDQVYEGHIRIRIQRVAPRKDECNDYQEADTKTDSDTGHHRFGSRRTGVLGLLSYRVSQRVVVVLSWSFDIPMCTVQSNPSIDKIKGRSAIIKAVPTEFQSVLFANWKKASCGLFLGSRSKSTKDITKMPPVLTIAMNASKKGSHFARKMLKR